MRYVRSRHGVQTGHLSLETFKTIYDYGPGLGCIYSGAKKQCVDWLPAGIGVSVASGRIPGGCFIPFHACCVSKPRVGSCVPFSISRLAGFGVSPGVFHQGSFRLKSMRTCLPGWTFLCADTFLLMDIFPNADGSQPCWHTLLVLTILLF